VALPSQVPYWLDTSKVKVVLHKDFIDSSFLPTFNSQSIELYLFKIANLSSTFIYFNDDYFIGRHIYPWDLLTERGGPKIFLDYYILKDSPRASKVDYLPNDWGGAMAYTNGLLDEKYGYQMRYHVFHAPHVWNQKIWNDIVVEFATDIHTSRAAKTRIRRSIVPEYLYAQYIIYSKKYDHQVMGRSFSYWNLAFVMFSPQFEMLKLKLADINRWRYKFFCLNDDRGENYDKRIDQLWDEFMGNYYYSPSKFEKVVDSTDNMEKMATVMKY